MLLQPRTLVVVDFDMSLVDVNSDSWLLDKTSPSLREGSERMWEEFLKTDKRWAVFLDDLMNRLFAEGVREEQVSAAFQSIPVHPGMVESIRLCHQQGCEVVMISGSCSYIINLVLEHYQIRECISAIQAHGASWEEGRLRIHPYHSSVDGESEDPKSYKPLHNKHSCLQCPADLCKGAILSEYMSSGRYNRFYYIGDSTNDYCPCALLSTGDHVLARKGFNLHLLSESPQSEPLGYGDVPAELSTKRPPILASLHLWESGADVLQVFQSTLNHNNPS